MELDMAKGAKKKGFHRYISWKRKVQEGIPFLVSNTGTLVKTDKKAEVFKNIFALVFTNACSTCGPELNVLKSRNRGSPLLL